MDDALTRPCRGEDPDLGTYVLGALSPAERSRFEAHLATCPACRDEVAALAGMPGLLGRVSLEDVERAASPPPPADAERLLARIARHRRRRRLTAVAGLAAVAALAGGIVGLRAVTAPGPDSAGRTVVAGASGGRARGQIMLRPAAEGTRLAVSLHGVVPGTRCRLVVVARNGRREGAGGWRASYDGEASVRTVTSVPLADIAALEVRTDRGMLMRARL